MPNNLKPIEQSPMTLTGSKTVESALYSTTVSHDNFMGQCVCKNYKIVERLGKGSFGRVYMAQHVQKSKQFVAIKVEVKDVKYPQLHIEYALLSRLRHPYFPRAIEFQASKENAVNEIDEFNMMAMELMGPNLYDLRIYCNYRFSLKTCLMLFDQMIDILQCLHSHKIVHRDIKPQNFVMGPCGQRMNFLYLIDFGFAKKVNPADKETKKVFLGTPVYASLAMHKGIKSDSIDDIESALYVIVQCLKGRLPWDGIRRPNKITKKEWYKKIEAKKERGLKSNIFLFNKLLDYIRNASEKERAKPNYDMFKNTIDEMMANENIKYDFAYDWYLKRAKKFK